MRPLFFQVRSLLACWTSAVAGDPFVVLSAGRSHFPVSDLIELARQSTPAMIFLARLLLQVQVCLLHCY
ncbi:MAG: hypothetical protein GY726_14210 [Proteobacteria bacterium]|nr:hypothetical protein [Pseudomonadota bacterium]